MGFGLGPGAPWASLPTQFPRQAWCTEVSLLGCRRDAWPLRVVAGSGSVLVCPWSAASLSSLSSDLGYLVLYESLSTAHTFSAGAGLLPPPRLPSRTVS